MQVVLALVALAINNFRPFGSLVAENELRHFLKLARPEWSKPRRRGRSDIVRVLAKLKAVGVNDIDTLIRKVEKNTINEELYNKGLMPLSRAALDSIRKQKTFMQALESVDVPNIRQVGVFDPVAQMLRGSRQMCSSRMASKQEIDKLLPWHVIVSIVRSRKPLPSTAPSAIKKESFALLLWHTVAVFGDAWSLQVPAPMQDVHLHPSETKKAPALAQRWLRLVHICGRRFHDACCVLSMLAA
ncbi:unnamed protein product [Symbiodinium natans]|uniref:Uncharacterized protein n=1 Tax=Symbiodinium natans TaxID=878477 RepID=A0A812T281_9DINO|nr:unnamed protein product [Symbiodinium natans]